MILSSVLQAIGLFIATNIDDIIVPQSLSPLLRSITMQRKRRRVKRRRFCFFIAQLIAFGATVVLTAVLYRRHVLRASPSADDDIAGSGPHARALRRFRQMAELEARELEAVLASPTGASHLSQGAGGADRTHTCVSVSGRIATRMQQVLAAQWFSSAILQEPLIVAWTLDWNATATFEALFDAPPATAFLYRAALDGVPAAEVADNAPWPPAHCIRLPPGNFASSARRLLLDPAFAEEVRRAGWAVRHAGDAMDKAASIAAASDRLKAPRGFSFQAAQAVMWSKLVPQRDVARAAADFAADHGLAEGGAALHEGVTWREVGPEAAGKAPEEPAERRDAGLRQRLGAAARWLRRVASEAAPRGLTVFLPTSDPLVALAFRRRFGKSFRVVALAEEPKGFRVELRGAAVRLCCDRATVAAALAAARCREFRSAFGGQVDGTDLLELTGGAAPAGIHGVGLGVGGKEVAQLDEEAARGAMMYWLFRAAHPKKVLCPPVLLNTFTGDDCAT